MEKTQSKPLVAQHDAAWKQHDAAWEQHGMCESALIIIIIIIIFIICNWGFSRWQWIIYMYTFYNIATKFTSGGLHEKHVVATWNFGNHLSICY
jgi:hypothetical protein